MTYELLIGDRSYSSWSLRGWLLFEAFGIPARTTLVRMYDPAFAETLRAWPPARTVPVARRDGATWHDSLAIAEALAEAHPDAGHWPTEPRARALARSIAAEMHSGFGALRGACPMNLRTAWRGFEPDEGVRADLARIEHLWGLAYDMAGEGPWLFGAYSAADAFLAPVAMRIAGYGLPVGEAAQAYVALHLGHAPLRRWRAMGEAADRTLAEYDMGLERAPFPMPEAIPAEAVAAGPSENARCPYSGDPVTHFARIGGRVFGFCNAACRDKTVADPDAWPAFRAIYHS
ncbi:glutathione S-transferase [Jannaschia sp. W003]|uniref:glutathione S-transferase n=1 Tax=Jannaschia sp. W003 TaxID=2867012 RepID=UPI0021A87958|nr:glutathione S-transferase [Jannaschia sp. W003]UWQ22203.1 glutathione S-transferase [Jannaschia sp. W003]